MAELKPCPFCGQMPVRKILPSGMEYIACENPKCMISPVSAAYRAEGKATRAWNRRIEDKNGV